MDPFQFLLLAEWLLKNARHPAGFRSAVSRAYYAAHHFVRISVESTGVHVKGGAEAHAHVWNHLANTDDAEIEQAGSDLSTLHSERNQADYRLDKTHIQNEQTTITLVTEARELIEVVRRCRADS